MSKTPAPDPRKLVSTSKREMYLAIAGALIALGLGGYAVFSIGNSASRTFITGKIVAKKLVPRPEKQITFGAGGVRSQEKAGLYYLSVRANDTEEIYQVLVDRESYERVTVGDPYQIPRASLVGDP